MILSDFHPLTLLDYPGKAACIVFTVGCNFRCGFCHNPNFVLPERITKIKDSFMKEKEFFQFLEKRIGLLDGVVICGGEPTMQPNLETFIRRIKSMGFLVKLDTNGSTPEILEKLLFPVEWKPLIDMVAMDVKRDIDTYDKIETVLMDTEISDKIRKSMKLVAQAGIEIEFRTTAAKGVHTPEMIAKIVSEIANLRDTHNCNPSYALQNFRSGDTLDPEFIGKPFTSKELERLAEVARMNISGTVIRN